MPNAPVLDKFPSELKRLRRWVTWRYLKRGARMTKKPLQSTTMAASWLFASEACEDVARGVADGVGFVVGDGIVGVDLDECIDQYGGLNEVARDALALHTYAERSPRRRGLHIWIKCSILQSRNIGGGRDGSRREIYDGRAGSARFLTVTGDRIGGATELRGGPQAQAAVDAFYAKWFTVSDRQAELSGHRATLQAGRADDEVLQLMFSARDGVKSHRLFDGDCSGYASQSEGDLALCRKLRFYARGDTAQIDRLFRRSQLMRSKWDEHRGTQTYGQVTIGKALAAGGPTYAPHVGRIDRDAVRRRAATKFAKVRVWWAFALQGAGELAFRVILVIAMYADENGEAYPSIATIALLSGVSERRVQSAIRRIEASGVMSIVRRAGTSNLYRLALRVPETIIPYAARRRPRGVLETGTLGVTPVVPTNIPRTDQELDTGERATNTSTSESAGRHDDLVALRRPRLPSATGLSDANKLARSCGSPAPYLPYGPPATLPLARDR